MHVLVTGGAGFIGSHVAAALLAAGHQVTVLDDLSAGLYINVPPGARFVAADITSADIHGLCQEIRPQGIVHCAAQVSVAASLKSPVDDLRRNVLGTVNLLQAAGQVGVASFVFASSAAIYGTPQYLPIDEDHPAGPLSPYGLSKLAGEGYVRMLARQFGMRWVILRYANVYGPRQLPQGDGAVVPAFLHAFRAGQDPVIHGDGTQTRDFIYVADVVRANLLALTTDRSGTFNIGTGVAVSIRELWEAAATTAGWRRSPVYAPSRDGDIPHSVLATVRTRTELNWQPQTNFMDGLRACWHG